MESNLFQLLGLTPDAKPSDVAGSPPDMNNLGLLHGILTGDQPQTQASPAPEAASLPPATPSSTPDMASFLANPQAAAPQPPSVPNPMAQGFVGGGGFGVKTKPAKKGAPAEEAFAQATQSTKAGTERSIAALEAQGKIEAEAAPVELAGKAKEAALFKQQYDEAVAKDKAFKAEIAQNLADYKQMLDTAPELDPNRFYKNKSTAQNIGNVLALFLGGMLKPGEENIATKMIQRQVDNDIDAQKQDYLKYKDRVEAQRSLYGMNLQRWGTERAADAAMNAMAQTAVTRQLEAELLRVRSPEAQIKIQTEIAKRQIEQGKALNEIGNNYGDYLNAKSQAATAAGNLQQRKEEFKINTLVHIGDESMKTFLHLHDEEDKKTMAAAKAAGRAPETSVAIPSLGIPGDRPATITIGDKIENRALRDKAGAVEQFQALAEKYIQQSESLTWRDKFGGVPGFSDLGKSEKRKDLEATQKLLYSAAREMNRTGQNLTRNEEPIIERQVGQDVESWIFSANPRARLEAVIDGKKVQMNSIFASYGVIGPDGQIVRYETQADKQVGIDKENREIEAAGGTAGAPATPGRYPAPIGQPGAAGIPPLGGIVESPAAPVLPVLQDVLTRTRR